MTKSKVGDNGARLLTCAVRRLNSERVVAGRAQSARIEAAKRAVRRALMRSTETRFAVDDHARHHKDEGQQ